MLAARVGPKGQEAAQKRFNESSSYLGYFLDAFLRHEGGGWAGVTAAAKKLDAKALDALPGLSRRCPPEAAPAAVPEAAGAPVPVASETNVSAPAPGAAAGAGPGPIAEAAAAAAEAAAEVLEPGNGAAP